MRGFKRADTILPIMFLLASLSGVLAGVPFQSLLDLTSSRLIAGGLLSVSKTSPKHAYLGSLPRGVRSYSPTPQGHCVILI